MIVFVDAVRTGGVGCRHFDVTVQFDNGQSKTKVIDVDQLEQFLQQVDDIFPGSDEAAHDGALALLWVAYQFRHGRTIAQMRGATIAEPL